MTEAANGKARISARERSAGEFPHSLPGLRTEVVLFDSSDQMVQSLGSHDEALRFIEAQFPAVDFHVRGNELAISGPAADVPRIMRLLNEVRGLVARGTVITPAVLQQLVSMLRTQSLQNPVEVLTHNILSSRGKTIRPKTLNQKNYVDAIDDNTVIFGIGPAGTGKTYLAMAKAVQALQQKEVTRIILTRPAVEAGERLGFLPGTLSDKIDPYLRPLYDALHEMMDPESIPRLIAAGTIEVAPLAYMRGRTLNDAFIILDEAQNTTPEQMKMFLTRLGFGSKMVVTGDVTQVDLPFGTRSGLRIVGGNPAGHRRRQLHRPGRLRRRPAPPGGRHRQRLQRLGRDPEEPGQTFRCPGQAGRTRMSIEVNNESGVTVDEAELVQLSRFIFERLFIHPQAELSILLVDEPAMEKLHIELMDEPGSTDVLSVPMDELTPGTPDKPTPQGMLGDIAICPQVAEVQAMNAGHSTQDEMLLLTTHGILHLLGFDHAEPEEKEEMFGLQRELLSAFTGKDAPSETIQ